MRLLACSIEKWIERERERERTIEKGNHHHYRRRENGWMNERMRWRVGPLSSTPRHDDDHHHRDYVKEDEEEEEEEEKTVSTHAFANLNGERTLLCQKREKLAIEPRFLDTVFCLRTRHQRGDCVREAPLQTDRIVSFYQPFDIAANHAVRA